MFLGGMVLLGVLMPLWITWRRAASGAANDSMARLAAVLVLLAGSMLRISLVQAGQL